MAQGSVLVTEHQENVTIGLKPKQNVEIATSVLSAHYHCLGQYNVPHDGDGRNTLKIAKAGNWKLHANIFFCTQLVYISKLHNLSNNSDKQLFYRGILLSVS